MRESMLMGGDLSRMSVYQLQEVMLVLGPDEPRSQSAARVLVREMVEIEAVTRLTRRHRNFGYAPVSTAAGAGEGRGEVTGMVDHVLEAAVRYSEESDRQELARAMIGNLTEHQAAAVLMCSRSIAREMAPRDEDRVLTSEQLAHPSRQVLALQRLGFPPGGGCRFPSAGAMRKAATQGRQRMCERLLAGLRFNGVSNDVAYA